MFAEEMTKQLFANVKPHASDVFLIIKPESLNWQVAVDRLSLLPVKARRLVAEESAVLLRLAHAMSADFAPGYHSIIRAWRDDHALICLNERFDEIRVQDTALHSVHQLKGEDLNRFDVSSTGSYLHWPNPDVHLGWSQLMALIDEGELLRQNQESTEFNERYGSAIRSLREENGLTQSEVTGITERHLRRIEQGKQRATTKALNALAKTHKMELSEYTSALSKRL